MSRFEVDSAQVSAASTSVKNTAGTVAGEVDQMMRQLLDLQSSWRGGAATSFQAVVSEWKLTQQRVHHNLEQITTALANAGKQYADAEAANLAMFNK